ncbi:MAG: hydroxymethylbilane synthase [Nitrospinota bacterium]
MGTRRSALARAQSRWVVEEMRRQNPGLEVEEVLIRTTGDKLGDRPLGPEGGKGLFVKEVEEALLAGSVDFAVHSLKDLPAELPPGLSICAVPPREDPRDALVSRDGLSLDELPPGARVGTSSLRRQALLLRARPDLKVVPLRGNLDTRLRKLRDGEIEAIVVALAGLRRLGAEAEWVLPLDEEIFLPAMGQGALALEAREGDGLVRSLVETLDHESSRREALAERAFMAALEGSCRVPAAGRAVVRGEHLRMRGMVATPDGRRAVEEALEGPAREAEALGAELGRRVLGAGGCAILEALGEKGV